MTGAQFILSPVSYEPIFTSEGWNEEQRMLADSFNDFIQQQILPQIDEIDAHTDPNLVPSLLEQAGELGLLALGLPEAYGGFAMDFRTSMLFGEASARGFSFATSIGAQTSIGMLPILYYGNDAQKEKYLPKLGTGEWKTSYCLTEPDAGSDANSGKARAVLNAAGTHYVLNGQKMWITNGGFADVFVVFAKIDDDPNLSAFIVEKAFGGIELGQEEKKLGIKGSSTVQVFFNDCPVPVENLLAGRGEGFKIALNILNSGRIKLAVGSMAGGKMSTEIALRYALARKQFGKPILQFGAIRHKIATMAARTFAAESACYRLGGYIDDEITRLVASGETKEAATLQAMRLYAIEASIIKVHGSEVLAYCVDEALQVHGGMGYSADLPLERAYRDARITRIYEGTNEINRLLSVGELFKRGMVTKELPLLAAFKGAWGTAIGRKLTPGFLRSRSPEAVVNELKTAFLLTAGFAASRLGKKLTEDNQQGIVLALADMLAEAYVCESLLLRVSQLEKAGHPGAAYARLLQRLYFFEAVDRVRDRGEEALCSVADGATLTLVRSLLRALSPRPAENPVALRNQVVEALEKEERFLKV